MHPQLSTVDCDYILNWVSENDAESAWQDFLSDWQSFARLLITVPLVERASHVAREYELRGYDATHFAALLIWQETLEMPIVLATYDHNLWSAAKKAGVTV